MADTSETHSAHELITFIQKCPSMFHTAHTVSVQLEAAGFTYLSEGAVWEIAPGGCYYTRRNESSVIAFKVGAEASSPERYHFQLTAAHGDSPSFKIKATPELTGERALRLNVEAYGGMIDYTWFDRPLSVAGRVLVRTKAGIESRLIAPDRDLAIIPSLAIHLDRSVNEGFAPNHVRDLCPLISAGVLEPGSFNKLIAEEAGVDVDQILAHDLFLVSRVPGCVWGETDEFVSSSKLDDLMCAYTSLEAFMVAENAAAVNVWCCFDNEEVGSNTKQGAMSTFLPDTLTRLTVALGLTDADYRCALAKSMLVSCDNAHALHPNRPEMHDTQNSCRMNGGIVVKEAANQRYCTDAFSRAVFTEICNRAGVPHQSYANRSDIKGGATLGNLSNMQASMHALDVGCAQLAMHSSYETAGAHDVDLAYRALRAFFEVNLKIDGAQAAAL